LNCLSSLRPEITEDIRVVVVDNDSGEGSAEQIEQAIERLGFSAWAQVLRSSVNGGFAAENNLGIRAVDAAAYLLLKSDTLVRHGAIAELRAAMRARPDVGIIGPSLTNAAGQHDDSAFRAPAPLTEPARAANGGLIERMVPHLKPALRIRSRRSRPTGSGLHACWCVRQCFERSASSTSATSCTLKMSSSVVARAAGWKILYWPAAKVVHLLGGSSGVTTHGAARKRAPCYYYESRARYFASYYGRHGLLRANAFWYLGHALSLTRELPGAAPQQREREAVDIWTNALRPLAAASSHGPTRRIFSWLNERLRASYERRELPSHAAPLPSGRHNQNPYDLGLLELLAEDFVTYEKVSLSPVFGSSRCIDSVVRAWTFARVCCVRR
jgi:GT2 family glycosyltransferase